MPRPRIQVPGPTLLWSRRFRYTPASTPSPPETGTAIQVLKTAPRCTGGLVVSQCHLSNLDGQHLGGATDARSTRCRSEGAAGLAWPPPHTAAGGMAGLGPAGKGARAQGPRPAPPGGPLCFVPLRDADASSPRRLSPTTHLLNTHTCFLAQHTRVSPWPALPRPLVTPAPVHLPHHRLAWRGPAQG